MQAVRRAVEADIGGDGAGPQLRIQRRRIGDLVDIAALLRLMQEVGSRGRSSPQLDPDYGLLASQGRRP